MYHEYGKLPVHIGQQRLRGYRHGCSTKTGPFIMTAISRGANNWPDNSSGGLECVLSGRNPRIYRSLTSFIRP